MPEITFDSFRLVYPCKIMIEIDEQSVITFTNMLNNSESALTVRDIKPVKDGKTCLIPK